MVKFLTPSRRVESLEPRELAKYARKLSDHWEHLGRPAISDCSDAFQVEYLRVKRELERRGTQLTLFD